MKKLIVAGVGGQGVTFSVRLLMSAAMLAGIKVATDEIHGLSQRGGVVNAGLTFGDAGHGYVDAEQADFLIGMERLEAQRCLFYLKPSSRIVIDNVEIIPFTVNAAMNEYPDIDEFVKKLKDNIAEVICVEDGDGINSKFRSYFLLGIASTLKDFPVDSKFLRLAIEENARKNTIEQSIDAFNQGRQYLEPEKTG